MNDAYTRKLRQHPNAPEAFLITAPPETLQLCHSLLLRETQWEDNLKLTNSTITA